ncbi:hypothetical protein ACHAWF_006528, partial [Thalassiosira exigua]
REIRCRIASPSRTTAPLRPEKNHTPGDIRWKSGAQQSRVATATAAVASSRGISFLGSCGPSRVARAYVPPASLSYARTALRRGGIRPRPSPSSSSFSSSSALNLVPLSKAWDAGLGGGNGIGGGRGAEGGGNARIVQRAISAVPCRQRRRLAFRSAVGDRHLRRLRHRVIERHRLDCPQKSGGVGGGGARHRGVQRVRAGGGIHRGVVGVVAPNESSNSPIRKGAATEAVVVRSSLILALARPVGPDGELEAVWSVDLRLQPPDAKIPFSQPWLEVLEQRLIRLPPFARGEKSQNDVASKESGENAPLLRPYLCNPCVSPALRSPSGSDARCVESSNPCRSNGGARCCSRRALSGKPPDGSDCYTPSTPKSLVKAFPSGKFSVPSPIAATTFLGPPFSDGSSVTVPALLIGCESLSDTSTTGPLGSSCSIMIAVNLPLVRPTR